jgi:site-specific recombinase XerD
VALATKPDLIDRFAASYFDFNEISPQRRQMQLTQLRRYEAFLAPMPIEQAGGMELESYLEHLMSRQFNANSVALYQNMIRSFLSWCWSKKLITGDQLLEIRAVKKPSGAKAGVPRPYSVKEMKQFWAEFEDRYPLKTLNEHHLRRLRKGTARYANYRDHALRLQLEAIVLLAVCCALRREEIFRLSLEDLHPDNAYLPVHGKGNEGREVPYTDLARAAVLTWLDFRKNILGVAHASPWVRCYGPSANSFNAPMSMSAFAHHMSKIGSGWELHRFRHTSATNWLREEMPLGILQRLLGHIQIQQTLRYAKLNREDIFRQVEQHQDGFTKRLGRPEGSE